LGHSSFMMIHPIELTLVICFLVMITLQLIFPENELKHLVLTNNWVLVIIFYFVFPSYIWT
jgi:hypothetical protein